MTESERRPILREPWSTMTLPGLAQGAAVLRPDRLSVADMEDSRVLAGRPPRQLTAAELQGEAKLVARKLTALGLQQGETVLVRLPNTSEAAIGILGVILAGGIPATLPVFEPQETAMAAARLVEAVGVLTIARFAGLALADGAHAIAEACPTVRFAAAFGDRTPTGVTSLDGWNKVEFIGSAAPTKVRATDNALISFDTSNGALRAYARTHEQLVAAASTAAGAMHVAADSRILATFPAASAAGVIHALVMPLLTGASVELMPLFDSCAFAATLGDGRGRTVLLPAACEEAFRAHCAERLVRSETLVFLHRPTGRALPAQPPTEGETRTIDLYWLGEALGWTCRRGANPDPRAARHGAADMFVEGMNPLKLHTDSKGHLTVGGPLAPRPIGKMPGALTTNLHFSEFLAKKGPAKTG